MHALATVALMTSLMGAGPPAGDATLAEARTRVENARKAFAAHKFAFALTEFQAAQRLKPAPVLWFNIGKCYEKINETASALSAFRSYLHEAPSTPDRREVTAAISRMEAKLRSRGEQQLMVFSNPPGATASISGRGALPVPAAWELKPGTYTVTISLAGYQTMQKPVTVSLKGSPTLEVTLESSGEPVPPRTPVASSDDRPVEPGSPPPVKDTEQGKVTVAVRSSTTPPSSGPVTPAAGGLDSAFAPRQPLALTPPPPAPPGRLWTWVAGGLSLAGAGVGVGFGLTADSARAELVAPGLRTEDVNNQLYSRAKSSAMYANIGYGAAAAAGVAAVALFFLEGGPSNARASATPAAGGAPLVVAF